MSSRVFISMLCVGAVAFACGPRAHSDAATSKKTTTSAATTSAATTSVAQSTTAAQTATQQGKPLPARKTQPSPVSAQVSVHRSDGTISVALRVVNTGKKRVEINFPSGQTYDFVVLDSIGREVWRWGNDRMFTQALRNKLLGAGETMDFEETVDSSSLIPGRYTARGTLKSANYPLVEEIDFTVTATTIASR